MATYHFPVGETRLTITVSDRATNAFEQYHGPGSQRRLFAQIINGRHTFQKISQRFNMTTRQAVHYYYTFYLRAFLAAAGLERKKPSIKTLAHQTLPTTTLAVKRQAERAGLPVECDYRLPARTTQLIVRRNSLLIAAHRCKIAVVTAIFQGRLIGFRLSLRSIQSYDFVILVAAPPGRHRQYFIIPTKMLSDLLASERPNEYAVFYIPIAPKLTKIGRPAAIDWSPYRSAWHLIARD